MPFKFEQLEVWQQALDYMAHLDTKARELAKHINAIHMTLALSNGNINQDRSPYDPEKI